MWRIENKESAALKPKQNSKNIWQNLKNNFLIQFLELLIDFGLEIQHGKKNYTLKMRMSNTTYGFKHSWL